MHADIALCYGTRPQVVKTASLLDALAARWRVMTVDTGQHYDFALHAGLYRQLGVRSPDHFLEVGSAPLAVQTAAVLSRAADVLGRHRPAIAIVVGDTNSTLGCALAAAQLRIPLVHVEAGLRAADRGMAEDINRRVVDTLAALLCAPSAAAMDHLRCEGRAEASVFTGDVAHDVLRRHRDRAPAASSLAGWPLPSGAPFIFATLHRAELVDDPSALATVFPTLAALDLPVVFAAHPRTRGALARAGLLPHDGASPHVLDPLGYLEAIAAVRDARLVITDSGGIQREAYWLGTPCITIRRETEWVETVEREANVLLPAARVAGELIPAVRERLAITREWDRAAYGDGDAAERVADAIARHMGAH